MIGLQDNQKKSQVFYNTTSKYNTVLNIGRLIKIFLLKNKNQFIQDVNLDGRNQNLVGFLQSYCSKAYKIILVRYNRTKKHIPLSFPISYIQFSVVHCRCKIFQRISNNAIKATRVLLNMTLKFRKIFKNKIHYSIKLYNFTMRGTFALFLLHLLVQFLFKVE